MWEISFNSFRFCLHSLLLGSHLVDFVLSETPLSPCRCDVVKPRTPHLTSLSATNIIHNMLSPSRSLLCRHHALHGSMDGQQHSGRFLPPKIDICQAKIARAVFFLPAKPHLAPKPPRYLGLCGRVHQPRGIVQWPPRCATLFRCIGSLCASQSPCSPPSFLPARCRGPSRG